MKAILVTLNEGEDYENYKHIHIFNFDASLYSQTNFQSDVPTRFSIPL